MESAAARPRPVLTAASVLPADAGRAALVARVHDPEGDGPCVAAVRGEQVVDLTAVAPTVSDLVERDDAVAVVREADGGQVWRLDELLAAPPGRRDVPRLLAPVDLQVIKAAGVTFARSLLERVIEERTGGDPAQAAQIRARVGQAVGGTLDGIRPGSPEADKAKELLVSEGLWSQYLEVGIGPDPEVFTKAPVLSAVGTGADIGVLGASVWNNPEPEAVLVVDSRGRVRGATLGNDVNLRDIEGRSALLLSRAKDNNASCAIGPFVRLFDEDFGLDTVRGLDIDLRIDGTDGYVLRGSSSMREISRDVLDLVAATHGPHHQYPDGFVLFTGTLFAPTEDRQAPGAGFTHEYGDVVRISSPRLGALVNTVVPSEQAAPWTFGVRELMRSLARRGLL
ncbi:fumarylacetoacetate hydrolase family protein [Streptomyces acidiscabies]|uniref:Fumarylacetoacetate hydrolase family protein n=1 Tax=Streptomyces acidiscabies TaxID=42234 RepID=A0AAP6ELB3_9ACTN|nr:fumarylacetoacetate hydrolase family protein [Streptomyces acidiscabies]MBP5935528.1 fumarylacetoacetate hydrolase family protein [Streptomyces sp. LBUM 1476]MBZ3916598.1 fumarylacetoacetate hydrolase family protein [Streptomyces acidiscabies]MDX2966873.1 fumarylacetoacetate hydrolase family protein [Streptomyces acidiscabies]MDX3020276.1 fumarylacetoacetate hydrolase family protein [Streptomyces acidiscabies]MDX3791734.1 fumarylacetoacetate hydrolase family protein [Streptomyces acidiscabi